MPRSVITLLGCLACCTLLSLFPEEAFANTGELPRISWKSVPGAVTYLVEVRRRGGEIAHRGRTENLYEPVDLEVGDYTVRITGYDGAGVVVGVSRLLPLRVSRAATHRAGDPPPAPAVKEKRGRAAGLAGLGGLHLGAGYRFTFALPAWNRVLDNSPAGCSLLLGFDLGCFTRVSPIKVLRNFGFDVMGSYALFPGREDGIAFNDKMHVGNVGAGLHYVFGASLPVQCLLRAGGGVSFTRLRKTREGTTRIVDSTDGFGAVEFALRFPVRHVFFIETGAGFENLFYRDEHLRTVPLFFRIGVRL